MYTHKTTAHLLKRSSKTFSNRYLTKLILPQQQNVFKVILTGFNFFRALGLGTNTQEQ